MFLDTYATEGIRAAIARTAVDAFSVRAMEQLLVTPGTHLLLAEARNHLIGFAQLTPGTPHELVPRQAPAELERLYVQEPFTRRGVGTRLMAESEHLAASLGTTDLWLTLWVGNTRAKAFYAGRGYRDVGESWIDLDGERHENRVLIRRLGGSEGVDGTVAG